jgi:hypothetical protein
LTEETSSRKQIRTHSRVPWWALMLLPIKRTSFTCVLSTWLLDVRKKGKETKGKKKKGRCFVVLTVICSSYCPSYPAINIAVKIHREFTSNLPASCRIYTLNLRVTKQVSLIIRKISSRPIYRIFIRHDGRGISVLSGRYYIRIRMLLQDQVVYYKYSEQSLSKSIVNKLYKSFDPSERSRDDYFRSRIGSIVWPPQICPHPIKRQCFSTRLDSAIFSSISVHTGFVRLILAKSARVASTLPPVLNDPMFTSSTSPLDSFGTYGYGYLCI